MEAEGLMEEPVHLDLARYSERVSYHPGESISLFAFFDMVIHIVSNPPPPLPGFVTHEMSHLLHCVEESVSLINQHADRAV